ncbi:MAG: prepilin-type N-terminal cleavage/methylation domain-containing protein [Pseudodesulfovibrio sp.]
MPMSTAGRSTRRGRSGFTLFELMIVIALLAIMASVTIPYIDLNVGGSAEKQAADYVLAVLEQARSSARLRRETVAVTFGDVGVSLGRGERILPYPDGVSFVGLLLFGSGVSRDKAALRIDRRGVAPVSIVRLKVNDQIYSYLINPVLREVKQEKGMVDFGDFAE